MPPKKKDQHVGTKIGRGLVLVGAAAAIAGLIVLSIFVAKVAQFAEDAPAILGSSIMGYVETEATEFLDAYVEEKLVPGLQEDMLGFMFGPASADDKVAAQDEANLGTHHEKHKKRRRSAPTAPQCPVRDESMCATFRTTCTAFGECRAERNREKCMIFVRGLNTACSSNNCASYYDHSLCTKVNDMCALRRRCVFNQTACLAVETEFAALCRNVV